MPFTLLIQKPNWELWKKFQEFEKRLITLSWPWKFTYWLTMLICFALITLQRSRRSICEIEQYLPNPSPYCTIIFMFNHLRPSNTGNIFMQLVVQQCCVASWVCLLRVLPLCATNFYVAKIRGDVYFLQHGNLLCEEVVILAMCQVSHSFLIHESCFCFTYFFASHWC